MRRLGYLTSKPYPIAHEDRVSTSAALIGGELAQPLTVFHEQALVTSTLTEGWMRSLQQVCGPVTDTASTAAILVGGSMRSGLIEYTPGRDVASTAASLVSGVMEKKLITYTPGRDVASTAANLVSGALE